MLPLVYITGNSVGITRYTKKRSAGCKAPVALVMHRPKWNVDALRRNGSMSLKRPAAGGESCEQDSIFICD